MSRVDRRQRRRLEFMAALVVLGFGVLMLRAADLQVWQASELARRAHAQQARIVEVAAARGRILDRRGRVLADSAPAPSIGAFADELAPRDRSRLARALGMSRAELARRLRGRRGFVWLARQVAPSVAARVARLGIAGVRIEQEWRRFYPLGPDAAQVLGFVGVDGHGLEGVEYRWDDWLAGRPGRKRVVRDARGRVLAERWIKPPVPGRDLRLTIDASLQGFAYAALAEAVQAMQARAGSVVVLSVPEREVLAMVNWPSFNPNAFRRFAPASFRNRAITDAFEPGSAMKPFAFAAALEAGLFRPDDRLFCERGRMRLAGLTIHDDHPFGELTLAEALARSSNICAAKVAMAVGARRIHDTLAAFGFGRKTGIGLPGESPGILRDPSSWTKVDLATIAFGQGVAVTALQLATAFAAIADGGRWQAPAIVGTARTRPRRRVIAPATARSLTAMLRLAASPAGTGARAQPAGWIVAGKTGTAQKPGPGGYAKDRYNAVFAGFAPYDHPALVVVVRLDEPRRAIYGGVAAAPVFRRIVAHALPYLGHAPEQARAGRGPLLRLAAAEADARWGLSLRELRRIAAARHLRLVAHGSGWLVRARPDSPARLRPGQSWEVWLEE